MNNQKRRPLGRHKKVGIKPARVVFVAMGKKPVAAVLKPGSSPHLTVERQAIFEDAVSRRQYGLANSPFAEVDRRIVRRIHKSYARSGEACQPTI